MRMRTKTVYYCDHCSKRFLLKGSCRKHEDVCNKRPGKDNICWDCKHLYTEVKLLEDKDGAHEEKLYFCLAREVPLHPTLTYIKSKDSVRMPNKACEYFVFKSRVGKL